MKLLAIWPCSATHQNDRTSQAIGGEEAIHDKIMLHLLRDFQFILLTV